MQKQLKLILRHNILLHHVKMLKMADMCLLMTVTVVHFLMHLTCILPCCTQNGQSHWVLAILSTKELKLVCYLITPLFGSISFISNIMYIIFQYPE